MNAVTTDLIALPPKETALQVYSAPQGLAPYLAKIKEELDAFVPDVSTKKGAMPLPRLPTRWQRARQLWTTSAKTWWPS